MNKRKLILLLLLILQATLLITNQPAPQNAVAATSNTTPLEFYSRTIRTISYDYPDTLYMNNEAVTGLGKMLISDDWVTWFDLTTGCGHCGQFATGFDALNIITGKNVRIVTATGSGLPQGYEYSANSLLMSAPYVVWTQPGKYMLPSNGDQYWARFSQGDFDCTICYYDLSTDQGGPISTLQSLDPEGKLFPTIMDLDRNGRVLMKLRGTSDLWVGSIKTAGQTKISTGTEPDDIKRAVFALFGHYAWATSRNIYIDDPQTGTGKQVGIGPQKDDGWPATLFRSGLYFFWLNEQGLQTYDGDPTAPAPNPNGKTVIPETGSYDVQLNTQLGDIVGWESSAGVDYRVANFDLSGKINPLLRFKPTSIVWRASMGTDKVITVEQAGTYEWPFDIKLTWLVRPDPAFLQLWDQTDGPVASGQASRSWLWGAQPNYMGMEQYIEGQDGKRLVRYYDKGRMEINNPNADKADPSYVTSGLLATEMIANEIQVGDHTFITPTGKSTIPVAGDKRKDNPLTPDYAALKGVSSLHGENQSPNRIGQSVNEMLDVYGNVGLDTEHTNIAKYAAFSSATGHNIPDLFWAYLQDMQSTYNLNWTTMLGYPISEAYWTQMRVNGTDMPVMIQAYQRRVLTYAPDFPPGWQVQMGNIGQHYYEWRYILNE